MALRRGLQWAVFMAALAWPPIHAWRSQVVGFSSWRYFGWGMYAMPHPESLVEVSVTLPGRAPIFLNWSDDLSIFLHVHDNRRLIAIISRIDPRFKEARVVITRQRLSISKRQATTENEVLVVTPQNVSAIRKKDA